MQSARTHCGKFTASHTRLRGIRWLLGKRERGCTTLTRQLKRVTAGKNDERIEIQDPRQGEPLPVRTRAFANDESAREGCKRHRDSGDTDPYAGLRRNSLLRRNQMRPDASFGAQGGCGFCRRESRGRHVRYMAARQLFLIKS